MADKKARPLNRVITREHARDLADAHDEGLHVDFAREFCPECAGRLLSSYPPAKEA